MSHLHRDDQLVQALVTGAYTAASAEYSRALRLIRARGLEAPRHWVVVIDLEREPPRS
jgi:hypothetical protein